ncbi:MAP kinase-interacting serine/threonine-protein kinase 2, partial [Charadrius vociferus]
DMPSSQPIDIPDAKKRNKKKKRCRATDSFSGRFEDVYQLQEEVLGEGAHARVQSCVNLITNKEYAVKVKLRRSGLQPPLPPTPCLSFPLYLGLSRLRCWHRVTVPWAGGEGEGQEHGRAGLCRETAPPPPPCHGKPHSPYRQQQGPPLPVQGVVLHPGVFGVLTCRGGHSLTHVGYITAEVGEPKHPGPPLFLCIYPPPGAGVSEVSRVSPVSAMGAAAPVPAGFKGGWGLFFSFFFFFFFLRWHQLLGRAPPFVGHCGSDCGWDRGEACHTCQNMLFESIQEGKYEFPDKDWAHISFGAKDLISKLLVRDAKKRLSAAQVLEHPWVQGCAPDNTLPTPIILQRNSSAKELTSFAAEAIAVNRQLTRRDEDEEEEAEEEARPIIIKATSRAMQLSPPSESKLAKRRQKSSLA